MGKNGESLSKSEDTSVSAYVRKLIKDDLTKREA